MTDLQSHFKVGLAGTELQTVIEALEAYLDAVYRSNGDVEYKHVKGEEIWRLRERLRQALIGIGGETGNTAERKEWSGRRRT